MSKLAHSNDETMAQIERDAADREQRGERDEPPERTPGPWRMHDMERATIVAGRPGGEVANCTNGFGDQDANAAFIVRACNAHDDLLVALRLILPLAKGYAPAGQTATARHTCNGWIEAAEAAIAKAEGRS